MPTLSTATVVVALPRGLPSLLRWPAAEEPPWRQRRRPSHYLQRQRGGWGRRRGWVMGLLNSESPEASIGQAGEEIQRHKQGELLRHETNAIRAMLRSMSDGEISISAYDTALVALVKNHLMDGPQFPLSISWIAQNQLPDGSWGDHAFFLVHDRIINTLACVVALKSWNVHADKCEKGLSFIRGNLWRLVEDDELDDRMVVGFEITFPRLLEMSNDLGLDMPYDDPSLQAVYAKRDLKLTRIPKDVLHAVPTALLLSIEGLPCLDWKRLLKLQSSDGSFLSSPAPTAYALMQTGDAKCLDFLDKIVRKFNGGVPFAYPVDLFERLWAVDRLERLGISRYFTSEIEDCLEYVYRNWSAEGLAFTGDAPVNDIDDTSMAFRLLRLHGYHVSPRVFRHFEKEGEFCCYPGESNQSVTAMYNLYRAAQVAFPDEDELERARVYCHGLLSDRRASNKLSVDKWLIAKDLPGEVGYALDFPWKASLPRIETRMYLEQYGGSSDVWIGKVLFRMPLISNDLYLHTAIADYSNFQRHCRAEWHALTMWCRLRNLEMFGTTSESALQAYFLAAANIFEPDRAAERLGWARTAVLAAAVSSHLRRCSVATSSAAADNMAREWFISHLSCSRSDHLKNTQRGPKDSAEQSLVHALDDLIGLLASNGNAASDGLRQAWKQWLMAWSRNNDDDDGALALLLVRTVEICSGRRRRGDQKKVSHSDEQYYWELEQLTSSICGKLQSTQRRVDHHHAGESSRVEKIVGREVDVEMQRLAQRVLLRPAVGSSSSGAVDALTRKTFLHVVRSFYYVAHCSPGEIDGHISKVIFEDVNY